MKRAIKKLVKATQKGKQGDEEEEINASVDKKVGGILQVRNTSHSTHLYIELQFS